MVERFCSGLHIVDVLATCEAVDDDLPPYKRDQIPSLLATDLPKLLVRDRVDAGPNCWVGRAPFPALAKVAGGGAARARGPARRLPHPAQRGGVSTARSGGAIQVGRCPAFVT